jgi:hypothetical protein
MRVLICGDRNWDKEGIVKRVLLQSGATVVIHGDARGADSIAGTLATSLGLKVEAFPADWQRYGRAAGPIRNQQMLDEGRPEKVIAFHPSIETSKGTADMVRRARAAGLPVTVVTGE